jgi:hypothetical protein
MTKVTDFRLFDEAGNLGRLRVPLPNRPRRSYMCDGVHCGQVKRELLLKGIATTASFKLPQTVQPVEDQL